MQNNSRRKTSLKGKFIEKQTNKSLEICGKWRISSTKNKRFLFR